MSDWISVDERLPEQVEAFKAALTTTIDDLQRNRPHWKYGITVTTDYGPDGTLAGALEAAKIDALVALPIKTIMWIDPGSVKVACGYGANAVEIYPAAKAKRKETA